MEAAGFASLRSSHLQLSPPRAMEKWEIRSQGNLAIKKAPYRRDVYVHAPPEWDPSGSARARKLRVAPCGLNVAPVVFYTTTQNYLLGKDQIEKAAGLSFCAPRQNPRLYYVHYGTRYSAGVLG